MKSGRDEAAAGAVISRLPNAGLGNKLFVWARGAVFAEFNGLPHLAAPWSKSGLSAMLRGERRNSLYGRYFFPPSLQTIAAVGTNMLRAWVPEPALAPLAPADGPKLYEFSKLPHWSGYFESLKPHRAIVQERFRAMLRPAILRAAEQLPDPEIAVHVRLGDFAAPDPGKAFSQQGLTRTPIEHFIEGIAAVRSRYPDLSVSVFSDGEDAELRPLLALDRTRRVSHPADIVELLAMSRARILFPSATSTFSLWAGFLGNSVIVHHPAHFHGFIRQDEGDASEAVWRPGGLGTILACLANSSHATGSIASGYEAAGRQPGPPPPGQSLPEQGSL